MEMDDDDGRRERGGRCVEYSIPSAYSSFTTIPALLLLGATAPTVHNRTDKTRETPPPCRTRRTVRTVVLSRTCRTRSGRRTSTSEDHRGIHQLNPPLPSARVRAGCSLGLGARAHDRLEFVKVDLAIAVDVGGLHHGVKSLLVKTLAVHLGDVRAHLLGADLAVA